MTGPRSRVTTAIIGTLAGAALLVTGGAIASGQDASPSVMPGSSALPTAVPGSPMAGLTVDGAWARVSPMVERAGAAYLVIHSQAATDDALIGVTSPAAAVVELHVTEADAQGMMSMHPVPEVAVPAGGSVELAPGGYHLMLIDLVAPLEDGTDVELVLSFRSGTTLTVQARVGAGAPMASPDAMGPGHAEHPMPMGSPTS
ncbi:MAG: copper chaperone PCu(A)C [Chloroflexi bacterium]|nr:copper chaperone PCu(A)C [Chloroflexota bacterium]